MRPEDQKSFALATEEMATESKSNPTERDDETPASAHGPCDSSALRAGPREEVPLVENTPTAVNTTATRTSRSPTPPVDAAPNFTTTIEPDSAESSSYYDSDSALGDEVESNTTSIASSIYNYKFENGRRYHAFREGEYLLPNDEQEQERLHLLHHVFKIAIGGELTRAPLENPLRALDLGTGTGNWAIDFADKYTNAEVIGVDLSPIQSIWTPPNCSFVVDDVESEWPYHESEAFDYIHTRTLCGSIKDWSRLSQQAYAHLKPGGWVEYQEYEAWCKSDDDSMSHCPSIMTWQEQIDEASIKFGKRMNVAETLKDHLIQAGFQNVHDDQYKIPIGPWPKDPSLKELGRIMQAQMIEAVEPVAIAFFSRVLGHSYESSQVLMMGVRSEFRDPRNHVYSVYRYIYGQKPATATATTTLA